MQTRFRRAYSILLVAGAACFLAPPQDVNAQVNWAQVPGYIDVSARIKEIESYVLESQVSGRLPADKAAPLKTKLDAIKQQEAAYRADGKLSVWERMRLIIDLDRLNGEITAQLGARTAALTDLPGRQDEIARTISEAMNSGRLTAAEGDAFKTRLATIKSQEIAAKADGTVTSSELLALSVDLDRLYDDLDKTMRTRVISDPNLTARKQEIQSRINDLLSTARITTAQADQFKQELARITTREDSFKTSGGVLDSNEVLTVALELEQLKSQIDRLVPVVVTPTVSGVDARQDEVKKLITDGISTGKLSPQLAAVYSKEYDHIDALEATYKLDGSLSEAEVIELGRALEGLKTRVQQSYITTTTTTATSGIEGLKNDIRTRLTEAEASNRLGAVQVSDLKASLQNVDAQERVFRLDGTLTDAEILALANELAIVRERLEKSLAPLPEISTRRGELDRKLNESLASGRLQPATAEDLRRDLERISGLEATFKASENRLSDQEVVSLGKEFDLIKDKLERSLTILPNVHEKHSQLDKKIQDANTSGLLSAASTSELKKELDRISSIKQQFMVGDNALSEWETMSIARDLDRLEGDFARHSKPQAPAIDTSAGPRDVRGHWAEQYVAILSGKGTIGGFPDGSFKPDDGITRAQFAAIAVRALGLAPAGRPAQFKDVSPKYWGYNAISSVSESGLVTGFPDGSFRPEDKITRAQALVILSKALNNQNSDSQSLSRYSDGQSVPLWALPAVTKAATAGIIVNYPNPQEIRPTSLATRAEVAALVYQTMSNLGQKLPQVRVGLEASGK